MYFIRTPPKGWHYLFLHISIFIILALLGMLLMLYDVAGETFKSRFCFFLTSLISNMLWHPNKNTVFFMWFRNDENILIFFFEVFRNFISLHIDLPLRYLINCNLTLVQSIICSRILFWVQRIKIVALESSPERKFTD